MVRFRVQLLALVFAQVASVSVVDFRDVAPKKHHKKHHHKHKRHHVSMLNKTRRMNASVAKITDPATNGSVHLLGRTNASASLKGATKVSKTVQDEQHELLGKMRRLEDELAGREKAVRRITQKGTLEVSGPLPADFSERFRQAVAKVTNCHPEEIKVLATSPLPGQLGISELVFEAPDVIIKAVEKQAADPSSPLANGPLRMFLIARGSDDAAAIGAARTAGFVVAGGQPSSVVRDVTRSQTPVRDSGIDVDTAMPYGELEPFGREDTAQELTEQSVTESDEMVDQLERAEVAEEKRAVFRALTRLRGAAITSFDGIARSQTGNIDEYNKIHKWRTTHPLHHLADEEADVSKWAFPDDADF